MTCYSALEAVVTGPAKHMGLVGICPKPTFEKNGTTCLFETKFLWVSLRSSVKIENHPLLRIDHLNSTQPSLKLFHRTWVLFIVQRTDPLTERTNDGKMNDYNLPIYTIHISSTLNSKKSCTMYIHVEMKNIEVERVLNEIAQWIDFGHQAFLILSM